MLKRAFAIWIMVAFVGFWSGYGGSACEGNRRPLLDPAYTSLGEAMEWCFEKCEGNTRTMYLYPNTETVCRCDEPDLAKGLADGW
jgi:hypothetical protein